jgi:hypothetical protein
MTKAGPDCITYILSHTFIRTASEMQRTLTMYRHHKLYIKATETKFSFTTQNYGILGCQSDSSRLVDEKNRIFQKDLHTQYFLSIGNLYVSMYKNLDLYVNYITEAVHQFSTESASVPSSLLDDSSIVSGIFRLIPTRIPNLNMPKLKYLEFDKFFKSQLNKSEDDLIAQFSNCVACIRLFCIGPCQVQQRRMSRAQTQHEGGSRDLYSDHEGRAWARGTL